MAVTQRQAAMVVVVLAIVFALLAFWYAYNVTCGGTGCVIG